MPIKNHEEYYEVSSFGRVRNIKTNKFIVGDINNAGYYRVGLYLPTKDRYFRHRLVALMFMENTNPDKKHVNHIDGSKSNNTLTNLEWVTPSENELHAHKTGLKDIVNRKNVRLVYPDGSIREFKSNTEASEFLGLGSVGSITCAIKRGGWVRGINSDLKIYNFD